MTELKTDSRFDGYIRYFSDRRFLAGLRSRGRECISCLLFLPFL